MANEITLYHGTSSDFDGAPTSQQDIWGLPEGVFFSESMDVAKHFATNSHTEGNINGQPRVYVATLDRDMLEDLTDIDEHDELLDKAAEVASSAYALRLPDMSGQCEDEILVVSPALLEWKEIIILEG